MTMAWRKRFWWAVLALAGGALCVFALIVIIIRRTPHDSLHAGIFLVPAAILTGVSAVRLRRLHITEPSQAVGRFHIRLGDLVLLPPVAGLLDAAIFAEWPETTYLAVAEASLCACILLALGLMVASRNGAIAASSRWLLALGFAGVIYGAAVFGYLVLWFFAEAVAGLVLGDSRVWAGLMLTAAEIFWPPRWTLSYPSFWLCRGCWMALPAGIILCRVALRLNKRQITGSQQQGCPCHALNPEP